MEKEQQLYGLLKENDLLGGLSMEDFSTGMKDPSKHQEVYDLLGSNNILGDLSFEDFQSGLSSSEKKSPDGSLPASGEQQGTVSAPTPETQAPDMGVEFGDTDETKPPGLFENLLKTKQESNSKNVESDIAKSKVNPAAFVKPQLEEFFAMSGPGTADVIAGIPDNEINKAVVPILKSDKPEWKKFLDVKNITADLVDQYGQEGWGKGIREEANQYEADLARTSPSVVHKEFERQMFESHKQAGYNERQGVLSELQTNTVPMAFEDGSDEALHATNVLLFEQLSDQYRTMPEGTKRDAAMYARDKAKERADAYKEKKATAAREELEIARREYLAESDPIKKAERAGMIADAEEALNGFLNPQLKIATTYANNKEEIDQQPGKTPQERMQNYLAALTYQYKQLEARQSKAGRDTPGQLILDATIRGGNADSERMLELDQKIRNIAPVVLLNESTYWQQDESSGDAFTRGLSSILLGGELSIAAGEKASRQQQGNDFAEMIQASGIQPEQLSKVELNNIKRKQEQYSWYDPEHLMATGGSSLGLMMQIMGASNIVKSTGLPASVGKAVSGMKKGKNIAGIFASGLESGATYEVAGRMFKNNDDELSFAGGFFGGLGQKGATTALNSVVSKGMRDRAKQTVVSVFGDKAADAAKEGGCIMK